MMTKPITTFSIAIFAAGLLAVGCGGGDDGGSAGADPDATKEGTAVDAEWEKVEPGGDCQCADGTDYSFWVRKADPNKVLFYLRGGGACWSAETCAQDGSDGSEELYTASIGFDEHPTRWDGIFDLTNESNPFADYSIVYLPYCTGDVFGGNSTTTYADGRTVQHKGYVNGTAALDYLATTFPDATNVVVAGLSAGSVTAPLYGGLASDQLPDADVTVLADGSGSYPSSVANEVTTAWGLANAIPDWPENAGLTAEQWSSAPGLFVQSGRHDPAITFARHDYAYDHTQVFRNQLLGIPGDLLSLMDANETQIEDAGVNLSSYIAPGEEHGVLQYEKFYTEEVNGEKLVDWVTRLVEGEPVDDVHCASCR